MTLDEIIRQIAKEHNASPEHIRLEMEKAMMKAKKTTNPRAKALWDSIPRKGNDVTLEELVEYIAVTVKRAATEPDRQ